MEAYLEDNRPTIYEVCESYDECNKECPLYRLCHPQAEREEKKEETEYQRQIEQYQHDALYEPTFDLETGSM